MTQSQDDKTVERVVNTVMGVKTEGKAQSTAPQLVPTKELDIKAVLIYKLGTLLQIGVMILALWGMEKLVTRVNNSAFLTHWFSTLLAVLFFTLLSIRSRMFSVLDNTRSRKTYDDVVRPLMGSSTFSFSHSLDDNCRLTSHRFCISLAGGEPTISSSSFNGFCGAFGFRRYLEYYLYRRTEVRCCCDCSYFGTLVIGFNRYSTLLANKPSSWNYFSPFLCLVNRGCCISVEHLAIEWKRAIISSETSHL